MSHSDTSPSISLIIPTLNESDNIERLVQRCHFSLCETGADFEIIVVDDNSADGTADIASALITRFPGLSVLRRAAKPDLAGSVLDGWAAATGDVLAVIDGDLQHPPEQLAVLYRALVESESDIAVASRHVDGGGVSEWALRRRIVSWGATLLATYLLPGILNAVRDPMSGYFMLRRQVLAGTELKPRGYKILLEILGRSRYGSLVEVPYVFEERKVGASKLGQKQAIDFLFHVASLSSSTGEARRIMAYGLVGLAGVAVNWIVARILLGQGRWPEWICLALAFECSVVHNCVLNEIFTFRDAVCHSGWDKRLRRFGVFQSVSLAGLAVNLGAATLAGVLGADALVAMTGGSILGGLVNFFFNTHVTWRIWKQARISGTWVTGGLVEQGALPGREVR